MKIGDLVYIKIDALKFAVQYQTGSNKVNKSKVLKVAKSPQVIKTIHQVGVSIYYGIELCKKTYLFIDEELIEINEGV